MRNQINRHRLFFRPKNGMPANMFLPNLSSQRNPVITLYNRPGLALIKLRLAPAGIRTGEVVMQTNRWFRFDKLTVCPGPIFPIVREDRYISNSTNQFGGGFDYRATLSTDNELLAMHDIAAVTNFFGFNPFLKITNGVGQTVYAGYYTLAPYDSIETLDVCFNNKRSSQNIDSILIRRGHFHQ